MVLSTARKIAEGVVMTPIFIVACAGAATAGLAIQGVTAAATLVKEKALGIEDSSDSDWSRTKDDVPKCSQLKWLHFF